MLIVLGRTLGALLTAAKQSTLRHEGVYRSIWLSQNVQAENVLTT